MSWRQQETVSRSRAAEILGCHIRTIDRRIRRGELLACKRGPEGRAGGSAAVLILSSSIQSFIDSEQQLMGGKKSE